MTTQIESPSPAASRFARGHLYVRPPEVVHFPDTEPEEEKVSETKRHLEIRTALYLVLKDAFAETSAIGSEQFVYWDPTNAHRCLSPDAFVKLGIPDTPFRVWKTWERGAPDLGVEIVSNSDRRDDDWEDKLVRYRAAGIRELVRFDSDDSEQPLRIWDEIDGDLVERAAEDRDLCSCRTLDLWWTVSEDAALGPMLRLARDREGRDLLPTPDEARIRAELAHRAAEVARDAIAIERDTMALEIERLKAELASARRGT